MHCALKNWARSANTFGSPGGRQIWVVVCFVIFGVLSPCAVALAEISWNAPPLCPTDRDFRTRVERLGGEHLLANTTANVRVDRSRGGFRARIQLSTREGNWSRSLEDLHCESLADSVALVLALSAPTPSEAVAPVISLSLGAGGIFGPLPRLAPHAELSVALQWSRLRISLLGGVVAPQTEHLDELSGRFGLLVVGMQASLVWRLDRLELAPGVGVVGYRFTVTGQGGATSLTPHALSWGPLLGLLARMRVSERWALCLSLSGALPLIRSRFVFSDAGTLHRPGVVALQTWLGVEVRL